MDREYIIDALNDLIETSKDGEYSFRTSAEHLRDPELKQLFTRRADDCEQAAAELQRLVVEQGGTAEDSGTAAGAVHRGWVAIKSKLTSYTDKAILEETERREDIALKRYRKVLDEALPDAVRSVVERQFEGVKRNHMEVRGLRDQAGADEATH